MNYLYLVLFFWFSHNNISTFLLCTINHDCLLWKWVTILFFVNVRWIVDAVWVWICYHQWPVSSCPLTSMSSNDYLVHVISQSRLSLTLLTHRSGFLSWFWVMFIWGNPCSLIMVDEDKHAQYKNKASLPLTRHIACRIMSFNDSIYIHDNTLNLYTAFD